MMDTCAVCGRPLEPRGDLGARLRCCTVVYRDEKGRAKRSGAYVHEGVRYLPLGKIIAVERRQ